MTVLYIVIYLIGAGIIWEIDRRSYDNNAFVNFSHNIKKRLILSLFSWLLLVAFGLMWLISLIIEKYDDES